MEARWENERVFPLGQNTMQKCLYFQDISENSENTNPDYMMAMAYQYSLDKAGFNKEKMREAIAKHDRKYLREKLGERNYSKYEKYTKNTLTDG